MGMYELGAYILIYSFIGWCVEVIYHTVTYGEFSNRGFVNGPVCTIYGFGFTAVIICLTPLKGNLLILFLGSIGLTTAIEFFGGWLLERIFHEKWWDYTDEKFNVKGYICLKFSLLWGLACTAVLLIIQPIVDKLIDKLPKDIGIVLLLVCLGIWIIDNIMTVIAIRKISVQLTVMRELTAYMRKISDFIGENLHETTVTVMDKAEDERGEFREHVELFHKQTEEKWEEFKDNKDAKWEGFQKKTEAGFRELREKYEKLATKSNERTLRRLHKAFPALKLDLKYTKFEDKGKENEK